MAILIKNPEAERAVREVQAAYRIALDKPAAQPMIYKTIRP